MEYIQIGFTRKSHGIAGEIKVVVEPDYEDIFLEADRVFLEIRGKKMPYFLASIRGKGDLIVHFEDIANREEAITIQSKPIFLPANEVPETLMTAEFGLEFSHLEGYTMLDQEGQVIGIIEEVLEMPQQEMALINYNSREVLIPLNEALIISENETKKEVTVEIPDGLLDL